VTEIRQRDYTCRTGQSHEQWVCRFILFCNGQSPRKAHAGKVRAFPEHPAIRHQPSPGRQNQALNALAFLYSRVPENH
jgi:hypothetical protein